MYPSVMTRPDIAFATSSLSQHLSDPAERHLEAAERVARYLRDTTSLSLQFDSSRRGGTNELLTGYSDADYANSNDRKSVSDMIFMLAGGPVLWKSHKQRSVATSTTESEYVGFTPCAKEGIWINRLTTWCLKMLKSESILKQSAQPIKLRNSILIYGDNQAALKIANNLGASFRTKHIDVQYHAIKEWIREGKIKLDHVTTEEMLARGCYELVLSKVHLSTDGYLTTKAPTTNPARKHCPLLLASWNDFVSTQAGMIKLIDSIFLPDERLFESLSFLQGMGSRISDKQVRDEASLIFVQNNAIEDPVRVILSKLNNFHPQRYSPIIPDNVNFKTTASNLRNLDGNRDTVQRDARLRTDQICVSRNSAHQQEIAYVIEYKAPHKLHTTHLELGLRQMNIFDEVVNKPTIPTADPDRFKHYVELLSAAATVQTYHYMLEAGLEYGYLTNGDAIVFLKIDWCQG